MAKKRLITRMNEIIGGIAETKADTERGLQAVGRNIRKNIDEGSENFRSKKADYYATINPLKGTVKAFKEGYNSQ